jgi:hypothetical protein
MNHHSDLTRILREMAVFTQSANCRTDLLERRPAGIGLRLECEGNL